MRDAILQGLLGCDIIGFQSSGDVRNFLMTCEMNGGIAVDDRERAVLVDGRVVYVRNYPISIDVASTTRLSFSHGVMVEERKLRDWRPEHLIVRIDRTDPSKNIVRGFLSYEKLLAHHPELKGKVQFWAFLQPSRQDVAAYRNYVRRVRQVVQRINSQYGGPGWQPVRLEFGESVRKAMAALRNFDVLVVNPVYDGLNLISKEGALVNRADGVIVLSENAGAHEELNPHVLSINPFDIMATANAMHQAIVMSAEEKKKRNESAREVVRTNDITRWITRQVQDIRDLAATPGLRVRAKELEHQPDGEQPFDDDEDQIGHFDRPPAGADGADHLGGVGTRCGHGVGRAYVRLLSSGACGVVANDFGFPAFHFWAPLFDAKFERGW